MAEIAVGTKVSWTHVGVSRRVMSMRLREGTVVAVNPPVATVQVKSGKQYNVALVRLRTEGQPSQIAEFVAGMRESSKKQ